MGSNFNEFQPKPGITILEEGKVKANKQTLSVVVEGGLNKISMEDY